MSKRMTNTKFRIVETPGWVKIQIIEKVLVLELSGVFTDVHYFTILYNGQNALNIKKIQARRK